MGIEAFKTPLSILPIHEPLLSQLASLNAKTIALFMSVQLFIDAFYRTFDGGQEYDSQEWTIAHKGHFATDDQ
jgi:hypothetical protein